MNWSSKEKEVSRSQSLITLKYLTREGKKAHDHIVVYCNVELLYYRCTLRGVNYYCTVLFDW